MSERVCPGVFVVGGPEVSEPTDCLCYGLDLGVGVLIDCGCGPGWSAIQDNLRAAGLDPHRLASLILTHAHVDHIGAAAQVVADSGCELVAHELDCAAIETGDAKRTAADWYARTLGPLHVDRRVTNRSQVLTYPRGELHLLHAPGHTPGSMVAWLDVADGAASKRVLFGQDIHGPFHPAFGSDLAAWRESMRALLALEADILCEGHFGVFHGRDEVRGFIEEHLRRHR